MVARAADRRPEVGSHVLFFPVACAIYLAGKISRSSSGLWAKTSGFSSSKFPSRHRAPESGDHAQACSPPSLHVVTAVADVNGVLRSNLQLLQSQEKRLWMRFVT